MKILGSVNNKGIQMDISVEKEGEIYKYYLGEDFIGVYDPDIMADSLIVFRENTLANELSGKIKDEITQVIEGAGKEEIEKSNELQNPDTAIQKNDKKEEVKETKKSEKNQNKSKPKENTTKDINIKQEVDMSTNVTDMGSMGERLEEAGKINSKEEKDGKLGFVESDDLKNLTDENGNHLQGHFSRYEAVVATNERGKDGGNIVRPLDLETDMQEGDNPSEENYQVNQDGTITKGDVSTRLKIQGNETIGVGKGPYGEVQVYHSQDKTLGGKGVEGNKSLDRQLETPNAKNPLEGTDQATQKLAQKNQDGYRAVEESYQEAMQHENEQGEPCEEMQVEDLDGDKNTVSHDHLEEIVTRLMEKKEISEKFTEREVREMVQNAYDKKRKDTSLEDFEKSITADIELDAENMKGERGK